MNTKQAHAAEEMLPQAFPETPGAIRRARAPAPWEEPGDNLSATVPPWVEVVLGVVLGPWAWWLGRAKR